MLCMHPDLTPPDFFSLGVPKRPNLFQSQTKDAWSTQGQHLPGNSQYPSGNIPKSRGKYGCQNVIVTESSICGKRCLKFKGLIKAMEDKVGEKMHVTQTYRPNLQIDVVLVC